MITIQFDYTDKFRPGEAIRGQVEWSDLQDRTTSIEVRLIWYTTGKGTQDVESVAEQDISTPGSNGKSNFEFIAPHRPLSFSGTLISLIWAIEVIVFPMKVAEQKKLIISHHETELVLSPLEKPEKLKWSPFNR